MKAKTMTTKPGRKKQPLLTRQHVLDVTATIILEHGLAAVTLDKVAAAADVSKGGLLHHFRTKTSLIEALLSELCNKFEEDIDCLEAKDANVTGRRTRAVLRTIAGTTDPRETQLWTTLSFEVRHNEELAARYRNYLHETLEKDGQRKDEQVALAIVSLAADGLAFADAAGVFNDSHALRKKILKRLEEMTRAPAKFGLVKG